MTFYILKNVNFVRSDFYIPYLQGGHFGTVLQIMMNLCQRVLKRHFSGKMGATPKSPHSNINANVLSLPRNCRLVVKGHIIFGDGCL